MRKQIIDTSFEKNPATTQDWLDLETLAQVQISSEQVTNPIELALVARDESVTARGPGWLASQAGKQTLRLLFDKPENIHLIHLQFLEKQQSRTQEFVLRYSRDKGASYQEILRQQYCFSPPSSCMQVENYRVQLEAVTTLELIIIPDISEGRAIASLAALQLA